jgi:D-alanyl-D-alanine carboxypeptidase/D-alanyl-D-alanine-endopeptidase (penicillin-binding protein 4)
MNLKILLPWFLVAVSAPAQAVCPSQLPQTIAPLLRSKGITDAQWGIAVETVTGDRVYQHQGNRLFIPASNQKLLTTAIALQHWSPTFQFRTVVYQRPSTDGEMVLEIVGQGDPSFSTASLQDLAQQLSQQQITQVDELIGNDSRFPGALVPPSWEAADRQEGYGAPINSLILNQNAIPLTLWPQQLGQPLAVEWENPLDQSGWQVYNRSRTVGRGEAEFVELSQADDRPILYIDAALRVGSDPEPVAVAVLNPGENFLRQFTTVLNQAGIAVPHETLLTVPQPVSGIERGAIVSAPLADLIRTTNHESQNLYAESLLKGLGTDARAGADALALARSSALGAGLAVMQRELINLGLDPQAFVLADGSGLSRQNLVTPNGLVDLLQAMARSANAGIYQGSLPVAGESGTLKNRFVDTAVAGRLQAKTGSLGGVAVLSGYLQPLHYPPLVFSVLINQPGQSYGVLREAIDGVVLRLSGLEVCPS